MAQDASQVRVGISGSFYTAPLGTTVPTTTAAAWPAGWVDMGLIDDDAQPEMTPSREIAPIKAWQKFFPVRLVKTDEGMEWKIALIQKSGTTLKLSFGGGTIVALGGGDYRFTPPAPAFIDERMCGLEIVDGTVIDRFILRRGFVSTTDTIPFKQDEAVKFALTITGMEPSAGERWELISNDPAMAL